MKLLKSSSHIFYTASLSVCVLFSASLSAQSGASPTAEKSEIDHSEMDHSGMTHEASDESGAGTDHTSSMKTNNDATDAMEMKSESAPIGTRDPHAYANGYTLEEGPYAIKGPALMDDYIFKSLAANRFEYNDKTSTGVYDTQAWIGKTFNRFVVKAEGDVVDNQLSESQTEALWGHAFSAFWDTQVGLRFDYSKDGKSRSWLAVGFQGLAPYWFEVDIAAYLGEDGRSALGLELEYELLFTQRLILQPRVELSLYGKDDDLNAIGQGLSDVAVGLRLRYEFTRQFAPYIGVERKELYGKTADFAEALGENVSETQYVAGVRFWF